MSNGHDPTAITDGVAAAEDAFEHAGFGQPTFEAGIDSDADWTTQLTKACQLIDGVRTIREHNGHDTAVIELCFGAIERSLEAWLLSETGDELSDLTDHVYVYERVDQQGLFSDGTGTSLEPSPARRGTKATTPTGHRHGSKLMEDCPRGGCSRSHRDRDRRQELLYLLTSRRRYILPAA